MINWGRILGFEWDEGNARKNSEKHDVSQSEAEQVFFNEPLLMVPDLRHSSSEQRVHAWSYRRWKAAPYYLHASDRQHTNPGNIRLRHEPEGAELL